MQKIQIERTTAPKAKPADESKLGFGKIFTDHMYVMEYNPEQGWARSEDHAVSANRP